MEEEENSQMISFGSVLTDDETTTEDVEKERQILESVLEKGKDKMRTNVTGSRAGYLMQVLRSRMENQGCVKKASDVNPYLSSSLLENDDGNDDPLIEQEDNSDDNVPDGSLTVFTTTGNELNNDESMNGEEDKTSDYVPGGGLTVITPMEKDGNDNGSINGQKVDSVAYVPDGGLTIIAPAKIKKEIMSDDDDIHEGKFGDQHDLDDESMLARPRESDNILENEATSLDAEGEGLNQPLQCANCFQEFYSIHEAQIHSITCTVQYCGDLHGGNITKSHDGSVTSASQSLASLNENYIRDNLEKSLMAAAGEELLLRVSPSTRQMETKGRQHGRIPLLSVKTDVSKPDKKSNKERTRRRKGKVFQHADLARANEPSNVFGSAEEDDMNFSCLLCNFGTTNLFDLGKHVNDMHGGRVASPQKAKTPTKKNELPGKKMYKVCVVCGMDTQDFMLFHGSESSHSLCSRLGRLLKQKLCINDVDSRYLCNRCVKRVESYEEAMVIQYQMKTQFENTKSLLEGKLSRETGNDSEVEYINVPTEHVEQSKVLQESEDSLDEEEAEKLEDQYIPSADSDGSWTPTGKKRRKRKRKSNKDISTTGKKKSLHSTTGYIKKQNGNTETQSVRHEASVSEETGSKTLRGLLSGPLPRPSPPISTCGSRLQAMLTAQPTGPSMLKGYTGVSGKATLQPPFITTSASEIFANRSTLAVPPVQSLGLNIRAALKDALATAPLPKPSVSLSLSAMPNLMDALSGKPSSPETSVVNTLCDSVSRKTLTSGGTFSTTVGSISFPSTTADSRDVKTVKYSISRDAGRVKIKTEPLNVELSKEYENGKREKHIEKSNDKPATPVKTNKPSEAAADSDDSVRRSLRKRRATKKATEGGVPSPASAKVNIDQLVNEAKQEQKEQLSQPMLDINELISIAKTTNEEPVGMPGYTVEEGIIRNFPGAVASYRIKPQPGGVLSEYICTQCCIVFYSEQGVQAHIQCHVAGSRELTCYLCQFHHDLLPTQWRIMKTHLVQNHKMDPEIFSRSRSAFPGEAFNEPSSLVSQLGLPYNPLSPTYPMNTLMRSAFSTAKEVRHKLDSQGKFEFNCQHCSTALYSPEARDLHLHCHVNKGKCFICPLCGYQHPSQPGSWRFMRGHIWKTHVPKPLPSTVFNQFECQRYACRLKFANSVARSVHESCHDDRQDGQFFCYLCGFRAPQGPFCWEPIRDHIILKHPDAFEGPYICICGDEFNTFDLFQEHIKVHS